MILKLINLVFTESEMVNAWKCNPSQYILKQQRFYNQTFLVLLIMKLILPS